MVTTMVIDTEWAESLKGLSMKVPDNWWPGYTDQILHDGKIDSFDSTTQKWNYDDALYLMANNAVCEYSNKELSTFHEFQLHHQSVYEGDDEFETADGIRYGNSNIRMSYY